MVINFLREIVGMTIRHSGEGFRKLRIEGLLAQEYPWEKTLLSACSMHQRNNYVKFSASL